MDAASKPQEDIAKRILPKPLLRAIEHVFQGSIPGLGLVGGTALAGYYAGHRRSDDLDLFTASPLAQTATLSRVGALAEIGATFRDQLTTPTFSHVVVNLDHHEFTVDVVLDANVHAVGYFPTTPGGTKVASLETLLMMKAATLVSRCGEKDLFDLLWLTEHLGMPEPAEWLEKGQKIDQGMTGEGVLIALAGATLRLEACGFATGQGCSEAIVFARIQQFKASLEELFLDYMQSVAPRNDLTKLFRFLRRNR